jgi:hypothetical protein
MTSPTDTTISSGGMTGWNRTTTGTDWHLRRRKTFRQPCTMTTITTTATTANAAEQHHFRQVATTSCRTPYAIETGGNKNGITLRWMITIWISIWILCLRRTRTKDDDDDEDDDFLYPCNDVSNLNLPQIHLPPRLYRWLGTTTASDASIDAAAPEQRITDNVAFLKTEAAATVEPTTTNATTAIPDTNGKIPFPISCRTL